ncbi:MAG TPA: ATP-binding cassette domain-containing protein [Thiobacillaceae bacterium]|nr:ATP-binding cassette domain-containing protein [Thiobacillaceae bacterium]
MAGDGETLLELRSLVAGHQAPVTAPASFSLARGETLGLLGPNGAGKSTLLGAILGTARIHAGELWRLPGLRLRHLPQRPARPAELPLSGRELLRHMDACQLPPPPALENKLDSRIDRLSGGEYQLLCLWACLGGDADLVLLDEPTNNLDRRHTDLAAEEINAERQRRACLVVSHDPAFLDRVCTRVLCLSHEH